MQNGLESWLRGPAGGVEGRAVAVRMGFGRALSVGAIVALLGLIYTAAYAPRSVGATSSVPVFWQVVDSPDQPNTDNVLNGLACATSSECWSVGSFGAQPLVLEDTGTGWSGVAAPSVGTADVLSGVTCVNATDCWAVGSAATGGAALI
jgi:hypothetical protein